MLQDPNVERVIKNYTEPLQKQISMMQIELEALKQQCNIGAVSSRTFEYRVIDHDMFDEDEIRTMNSIGSNGWEIIRIFEPMKWLNSDGMFVRIYYKREKPS